MSPSIQTRYEWKHLPWKKIQLYCLQASTADLQSQPTGKRQVSTQIATSANQILVRTASRCATGNSGESRQADSRSRRDRKSHASSTLTIGSILKSIAQASTLTTDLDSEAREIGKTPTLNSCHARASRSSLGQTRART